MKKYTKKAAACLLVGVMSVSMLTGCNNKKIDGTATVATVDGEKVPMGVVSLLARYQQIKIGSMYSGMMGYNSTEFWDNVQDEETGETYGDSTVKDVAEQVEQMYVIRGKAEDYNVSITEEEQQAIEEAAQAFVDANGEEVLEKLGASKEDVATFLELSAYQAKIHDEIVKDVDTDVSDEEAQQTSLTYTKVAFDEDASDEEKASQKEVAQQILEEVLATADADMKEIGKSIDEDSITINIHYSTNDEEDDTVNDTLKNAVAGLSDGEVNSSLAEGDDGYYIVRLEKQFDKDATETQKKSIITEREQELYDNTVDEWYEAASIEEDAKVLGTLKITSSDVYQEKQTGNTVEEEAGADAVETETDESTDTDANVDGESDGEAEEPEAEEEAAE